MNTTALRATKALILFPAIAAPFNALSALTAVRGYFVTTVQGCQLA